MNYFPAPNQRAYDLKLNVETTPPEDEFIDLRCVWAAECYPHDYLDKLFDDIQKLGWYQRGFFRSEEEAASWIKRSRQRPSVFGCLYIDTIYPCDGDIPVAEQPSALRAQLPSGVQYATAKIYSLTPSLVCVVMGFVFEKDFSARFQKALKTDRETYCKEPSSESGTQKICDPQMQKSEHISRIRGDMVEVFTEWFRENLPGVFSSDSEGGTVPTCEFVTFRRAEPFPEGTSSPPKYMFVLDMVDSGFLKSRDIWQSTDVAGLKLGTPYRENNNLRHHLILAANESYFKQGDMKGPAHMKRRFQILGVDHKAAELLGRWAVLPLLEKYHKNLNAIRDSAVFRPESRRKPLKTLEALDRYVSGSVDMTVVVNDLIFCTRENSLFSFFSGSGFAPCDTHRSAGWNLAREISSAVLNRATWLQSADQSLRDCLTGYGALLGATENVRLQRKLGVLTWVIVFLTFVLVLDSVFQWKEYLSAEIREIFGLW